MLVVARSQDEARVYSRGGVPIHRSRPPATTPPTAASAGGERAADGAAAAGQAESP
jgi:hypothetical protein